MQTSAPPVFRFAPSPNGALHLGHAYSALLNQTMSDQSGGTLLLRLEDIDVTRCSPTLEAQMLDDLRWLGMRWQGEPRRQSQHFDDYQAALAKLRQSGLIYPAFMTRGEIRKAVAERRAAGEDWPLDPDGTPHYPGDERGWSFDRQEDMRLSKPQHAWRLDMARAVETVAGQLSWAELPDARCGDANRVAANPLAWGDVVLGRSEIPTSYHLAVVLDDALQGVTHVVRGRDLFHATSVHRLLQEILALPAPIYHHHRLVLGEDGRKLSKSEGDVSLAALRKRGVTAEQLPDLFRF